MGDGDALQALFTRTRAIRRGIIDAGQETAEPDFGRHHGHAPPASAPDSEDSKAAGKASEAKG
jgi:cyclohexadieny/prephenate dehydrogenase